MSSPRCRSSPPDWSGQAVACCCTRNGTKQTTPPQKNGHGWKESVTVWVSAVCVNSLPAWAWSPGSSGPWVCVWRGSGEATPCEGAWPLIGQEGGWPQRCLACGGHANWSALRRERENPQRWISTLHNLCVCVCGRGSLTRCPPSFNQGPHKTPVTGLT